MGAKQPTLPHVLQVPRYFCWQKVWPSWHTSLEMKTYIVEQAFSLQVKYLYCLLLMSGDFSSAPLSCLCSYFRTLFLNRTKKKVNYQQRFPSPPHHDLPHRDLFPRPSFSSSWEGDKAEKMLVRNTPFTCLSFFSGFACEVLQQEKASCDPESISTLAQSPYHCVLDSSCQSLEGSSAPL